MINLSTCAVEARKSLHAVNIKVSHTTALELVAALLGYGSLAALKSDHGGSLMVFAKAQHVVFDPNRLKARMPRLGVDAEDSAGLVSAFAAAFRMQAEELEIGLKLHTSMEDFQDFIFRDVQDRAFDDPEVSSAYAETNAEIDEFYADSFEFDSLVKSDGVWILIASGTHCGETDGDRPYSGDRGDFIATYRFEKDGRCGLVETDLSFTLDFDRSFA